MSEVFWYRAHGLSISSTVELPELSDGQQVSSPDVRIGLNPARRTPVRDANRSSETVLSRDPERGMQLTVSGVATFSVIDGCEIWVTPHDDAMMDLLKLYTLGSAMGLLLMQRGALVLHASALVSCDGRAMLFLGPSGAGKSTLAARLAQQGFPILSDDTVALWPGRDGHEFVVYPAARSFKMWQDALDAAGISHDGLARVARGHAKYYLPNPEPAAHAPCPVGDIYVLERAQTGQPAAVERVDLLSAVQAIAQNLYRPEFADRLDLAAQQFRQICACADTSSVAKLRRPWSHDEDGGLIALIRQHAERKA